jgi:hypothetical protein
MKDFFDLWALSRLYDFDGSILLETHADIEGRPMVKPIIIPPGCMAFYRSHYKYRGKPRSKVL